MQIFFSIFWWIYFFIFFTGYPWLYGLVYLISRNKKIHRAVTEKIFPVLPVVYAFVITCFWLLMLYSGKTDFIVERIASTKPSVLMIFYSFTGLLFWSPAFSKKTSLSLLHSLPFLLMPPVNMLIKTLRHKVVAHDYIISLLRIYAAGLILYILATLFLLLIRWIVGPIVFKKNKSQRSF
jgi:hypothetical protein